VTADISNHFITVYFVKIIGNLHIYLFSYQLFSLSVSKLGKLVAIFLTGRSQPVGPLFVP